ncbi:MAG: FixH family protein [Robiginitomaculum sp.]
MTAQSRRKKELTGKHVLVMLVVFFGLIIAVNGYFLYAAVTTFRGEDIKQSYRQGLEYNETIAQRAAGQALGWSATANLIEGDNGASQVIIEMKDAAGDPLTGLTLTGRLRHPADTARDKPLIFETLGAGRYMAPALDVTGKWQLNALASKGDTPSFKMQQDIWIR